MKPVHIAYVLAILCGVGAWQVTVIPQSLMQMTVGPSLVPAVVVAGLSVLALLYGISAARGRQVDESQAEDQTPLPGATIDGLSGPGVMGVRGGVLKGVVCCPGKSIMAGLRESNRPD